MLDLSKIPLAIDFTVAVTAPTQLCYFFELNFIDSSRLSLDRTYYVLLGWM